MAAAADLSGNDAHIVASYLAAMRAAGLKTGRSTTQAAETCQRRVSRAGGWHCLTSPQRLEVVGKARSFASWLMVTGQLRADAELISSLNLHLGYAARSHCPQDYRWFLEACETVEISGSRITGQWNLLAKISAMTATPPAAVGDTEFFPAREALLASYRMRGLPEAGRNLAGMFNQLQLTLFHAEKLSTWRRPSNHQPVATTGWATITHGYATTARRYIEQVTLSLRPNTVTGIEHDLRRFGSWLTDTHPQIANCAELQRVHIEEFKKWLSTTPTPRTGKPLNRVSIKNALINLHCFFDRITDWDYPNAPVRPLVFIGDLPIIDKPLPRFLDDGAATKLLRAARADTDPLSRLIVELLARTGIRISELLGLTTDAVVQIGTAFWLRIPLGKMHNDRYIPLHPQLKELLDDWIDNHRPTGIRTSRLLVENHRPITSHRVTAALDRHAEAAGIGHVTAHQLRHTLATQAINRGMSLDAIAALLGHKTLAMTMVYARIADRTVAEQYFSVTEKVEALYDQPPHLPDTDEGSEMRKLRAEMHRRMLGNGYCARPVDMDCHFESICESCSFFVTTIEFRPTLQAQRDDAAHKGQVGRAKVFDGLLERLDTDAS
ncbi:integrase family protein [Gordonia bronchialis DSM 43247]|uniref:Integrase family protein n=3 Tax=Gordonia TaxID=2053 RepID=D0L802_GORB4|nr:tyrosine-type recombinase/integrase [Gordonia westfalica]ACY21818.1 integrase family protein [Gordonia bronchialis DSM 43247]STQ64712.1 Tyrosine recombinase XerD [Gordonia bronchialis]ACY21897.1 integrase family protein [Gordonia bronchialis DSM 43247]MDS1117055.1 tyrosine-type recombinase/integrase [Gordonia westfalica]STQ64795.1 Tyrosine recombinase XerD [Gordonia bronchialis]